MSNLKDSYSQLIALTQLYLLREYELKDRVPTDKLTHRYFRDLFTKANPSQTVQKAPTESITEKIYSTQTSVAQIPKPEENEKITSVINHKIPVSYETKTENKKPLLNETFDQKPIAEEKKNEVEIGDKPHVKNGSFKSFQKEFLEKVPPIEYQDFKQFVKEHYPKCLVMEFIPQDQHAQKLKNAWQKELVIPPIVILSFNDQPNHLTFLKNLAKAITLHIAPARVLSAMKIEQENKWTPLLESADLKLVIANDYGLYLLPGLMHYYKQESKIAKHYLHKTPLLLLSDLSLYLKEPQLKALLWRAIKTEFVN